MGAPGMPGMGMPGMNGLALGGAPGMPPAMGMPGLPQPIQGLLPPGLGGAGLPPGLGGPGPGMPQGLPPGLGGPGPGAPSSVPAAFSPHRPGGPPGPPPGLPPGLMPPGLGGAGPLGMPTMPPGLQGARLGAPGMGMVMGMPTMPGMPGVPGAPPVPGGSIDSEAVAQLRFQQVAAQYEMAKHAGIAPEIAELAEYHGLDERATRALDEEMKKRKESFDADMQALWVGLEGARNPSGLLMMKLKDMRMGQFKGMSALDRNVQEFAKRYRLDAQAAVKLGEVLDKRDDPDGDMKKIGKHLERSNKPSSLMMMLLRDLRDGKPVKDPEYAAAIGSRVHEKELAVDTTKKEKSRSRGRGQRVRSRSRDRRDGGGRGAEGGDRSRRDRSRSRRDRRRSRSRDRDRGDRDRERR